MKGVETSFDAARPWRTLWNLYDGYRRDLTIAVLSYLFKASPLWVLPVVTANIVDAVTRPNSGSTDVLKWNALLGAIMLLQNIPSSMLYGRFSSRALRGMETRLRSVLVRRLQILSIGFHQRLAGGALQTKVLRDVESIEQMSRQLIDAGIYAVASVGVTLAVTAVRMPVFLPAFLLLVPMVVLIRVTMNGKMKQHHAEFRERVEAMGSRVMGMIGMVPVTRAHASEDEALARVEASFGEASEAGQRLDRHGALFGAVAWVQFMLLQLGILVIGAWWVLEGKMGLSAGDLVLVSGYAAAIVAAVMQLNNMMPIIARGFEGIRSLGEVLQRNELEDNEGKERISRVEGCFRLEKVHFEYPGEEGREKVSLEGIDLEVAAGECIGIIGESGSGKSTLIRLLVGFHRPTAGRILLDGRDLHDVDLRSYRRHLSVVTQETLLFDGTVAENIAYGTSGVSTEEVWSALKSANAEDFVRALPKGLETRLGDRGLRLSGGQKQRLAIARAILRDPRVLVLDEATSALDPGSESIVQDALDRLVGGRTTFIVAHRLGTLAKVDRVIELRAGKLVRIASPAELARMEPVRFAAFARP